MADEKTPARIHPHRSAICWVKTDSGGEEINMLDWSKDRNRTLRKRAIAEDIDDQQQLWAAQPRRKPHLDESKTALREIADQMVQPHAKKTYGAWMITCESCGHQGHVEIELSVALTKALRCVCGHRQWLSQEDLTPPWAV
jgi:hypothetical protein